MAFDFETAVDVVEQDSGEMKVGGQFDFATARDVAETDFEPTMKQKAQFAVDHPLMNFWKQTGDVATFIRWPFWRAIEHPVSTIVTEAQAGKVDLGTIGRAAESFVPFHKVSEPKFYAEIWDNYYTSITGEKESPFWYRAMASYSTAMGIEPAAIKGYEHLGEIALTRPATAAEVSFLNSHPAITKFRDFLTGNGIDPKSLHPEGNIIKLSDNSELVMNNRWSMLIRGEGIRVPRWTKFPTIKAVASSEHMGDIIPAETPIATASGIMAEPMPTPPAIAQPGADLKGETAPKEGGGIEPKLSTTKQKAQAHIIANEKGLISENNKVKPQYRFLAKQMTGKTSTNNMTPEEATNFIEALKALPEPTTKGGKKIPPSISRGIDIVPEGFFQREFKKPTPMKLLTSQSRYAELLGVKELTEPFEIGRQELDLEYGKLSTQIDKAVKKLEIKPEEMAQILNTQEEAPNTLSDNDKKAFNYFRDLTRDLITRENAVRKSLGLDEIPYRQAYFPHIADVMVQEVIDGKYPLPEGLKYWSEQLVGKRVYNPREMQRKLRDDLLDYFSKDLAYAMKSVSYTALKEIYFAHPKYFFNRVLGALSKDKVVYNNLTPEQQTIYDAENVMPAATKKWLIDYVNIVMMGRQTALDESVNLWITDTPIKDVINSILRPFGKHLSQRPVTNLISAISRLPIYGVMAGIRPKQLIRNKFQTLQDMALYGVKNTFKGYLKTTSPILDELKSDSLFRKSYSGFEDMPAELRGKLEKIGLAPYQWTAISNVSQAMNSAFYWTTDCMQNPKKAHLGWADPQRTYLEGKDFLYPSEKAKVLKEMEYGAHTTQFQYIGMGMPEVFRYKALAGLTRLQSWWMNHWMIFHREAATRAFTGHTGYNPELKVTLGDRINYLKYLVIGGLILNTMGYERSFLLGTAPTSLPPTAQLALGLYTYFTNQGDEDYEKRKRGEAVTQIKQAALTFIPGYLSAKDITAFLSGDKDWTDFIFYTKGKTSKKPYK